MRLKSQEIIEQDFVLRIQKDAMRWLSKAAEHPSYDSDGEKIIKHE